MATGNVPITAGSGTLIRVVTNSGVDSGANQQVFTLADAAGNLIGGSSSPVFVEQTDFSATVSIAATATASGQITAMQGAATAVVQLTGTFVATLQVQVTADNSTWVNITSSTAVVNAATGAYMASGNLTAVGVYQLDIGAFTGVRVITTAYTSGSVAGIVRVANVASVVSLEGTPSMVLAAGAATIGAVGINAGSNLVGAVAVGGTTPLSSFYTSTTTNAATITKASAGNLQALLLTNTGTGVQYVKLFNATTVTLGTTAAVADIAVPASGTPVAVALGPNGLRFSTGIAYAVTGAIGATNNTAGAGGVLIAATYI